MSMKSRAFLCITLVQVLVLSPLRPARPSTSYPRVARVSTRAQATRTPRLRRFGHYAIASRRACSG